MVSTITFLKIFTTSRHTVVKEHMPKFLEIFNDVEITECSEEFQNYSKSIRFMIKGNSIETINRAYGYIVETIRNN